MDTHAPHILIVEDYEPMRELLAVMARGDFAPAHIHQAGSIQEATHILHTQPIDIMLIDPGLPDSHGPETIRALIKAAPLVAAVGVTAYYTPQDAAQALTDGAKGYYDKVALLEKWKEIQLLKSLLAEVRASN